MVLQCAKWKVSMRLVNLILLTSVLAACSTQPAEAPSGGSASQLPATLPALTPIVLTSRSLVLTIISPLNDAVVIEPQTNLIGNISRDAVLTVNEDIYDLLAGDFTIPVNLQEGPNILEIVASDADGNEVDLILTVTYQP
jgi:hypothetical protein